MGTARDNAMGVRHRAHERQRRHRRQRHRRAGRLSIHAKATAIISRFYFV